ncbi:MAG: DUF559 domain-containing protein [Rhizobacter sp.]|nr:DUF559 domain-containing protein [Chlorobiales bacterium]
MRLFNLASEKTKRRVLRKQMPKAETLLWSKLRSHQVENARFLRQYSVGKFVLDFYCPEVKLAIELDGASHFEPDAVEYDVVRQTFIDATGICFLWFTNDEVFRSLSHVVEKISVAVRERRNPSVLADISPLSKGRAG